MKTTMKTAIDIRYMPEGYISDCWIVTGAIRNSEIRFYRKLSDAKKYAKELIKEFHKEGYYPSSIVIEQRLADPLGRHKVIEKYNEDDNQGNM